MDNREQIVFDILSEYLPDIVEMVEENRGNRDPTEKRSRNKLTKVELLRRMNEQRKREKLAAELWPEELGHYA